MKNKKSAMVIGFFLLTVGLLSLFFFVPSLKEKISVFTTEETLPSCTSVQALESIQAVKTLSAEIWDITEAETLHEKANADGFLESVTCLGVAMTSIGKVPIEYKFYFQTGISGKRERYLDVKGIRRSDYEALRNATEETQISKEEDDARFAEPFINTNFSKTVSANDGKVIYIDSFVPKEMAFKDPVGFSVNCESVDDCAGYEYLVTFSENSDSIFEYDHSSDGYRIKGYWAVNANTAMNQGVVSSMLRGIAIEDAREVKTKKVLQENIGSPKCDSTNVINTAKKQQNKVFTQVFGAMINVVDISKAMETGLSADKNIHFCEADAVFMSGGRRMSQKIAYKFYHNDQGKLIVEPNLGGEGPNSRDRDCNRTCQQQRANTDAVLKAIAE